MSNGNRDIQSALIMNRKRVLDSLQVEDQLRVNDDALTTQLPGRLSNRNRVIYNPTPKASLPARLSSRNRTFLKDSRFIDY